MKTEQENDILKFAYYLNSELQHDMGRRESADEIVKRIDRCANKIFWELKHKIEGGNFLYLNAVALAVAAGKLAILENRLGADAFTLGGERAAEINSKGHTKAE